jgi:hypothetical protein
MSDTTTTKGKQMTTTQNTRPTQEQYSTFKEFLKAAKAFDRDARNAEILAWNAREEVEYATEAQVNYLISLLPRFYAIQAGDGITVETEVWEANGAIKTAALSKLTKRDASSWISAAKQEISAL